MLVLSGKKGDRFRVTLNGVECWVVVAKLKPGSVRLGFDAPLQVRIDREVVTKMKGVPATTIRP